MKQQGEESGMERKGEGSKGRGKMGVKVRREEREAMDRKGEER